MGGLLAEGAVGWALLALAVCGVVVASVHLWLFLTASPQGCDEVALSVVVIVHNQEQQIEGLVRTLAALGRSFPAAGSGAEIVVVDAGSRDHTPLILERLCRTYGSLRYVSAGQQNPWEVGGQTCASSVALLVDARGATHIPSILRTVMRILGGRGRDVINGINRE